MTTMTLRVDDKDAGLIKRFAATQGLSLSDFARQAMLEKIEDDYDLRELRQALAQDDGEHISHAQVMKEFGL
ncbi:hypothetical protein KIM372_01680 [Bombiscardovia nodaiensis]|uniref:CopG family transcriptional regulator n=1 Tax=Bombiscardovia nodaiensis TaxID=2932181 RepID=A0ABM8B684_9BIFI|nr:hypothetical protein KIM372_01680 [Bombiscardovia nodaiensis]